MKVCRWLGACLFVIALSLVVSVQGQEKKGDPKGKGGTEGKKGEKPPEKGTGGGDKLPWKGFEKGKTFWQEMTTSTEQTMKVMTMTVTQKQTQTFFVEWTTEKAEKDNYTVKQKIIGVKMDIEIGGNKISYDSTNTKEQQQNPLTDFFKALVNQEFTLHITNTEKDGLKVTKVEGRDKFIENLSRANPQLKPLLEAILSDKALEQMADPVFSALPPGGAVPKGDKWTRESKLNMGPIGKYTTNYDFTYKGTKEGIATIDVSTKLKYEPPDAAAKEKEGLPFKIVNATLATKQPGTGEVKFDVNKGRVKSSEMTMVLTGDLDIEIAGQTTAVHLDQTQKSSLTTLDANPIGAKK
jgi:hypothetical protein